MMRVCRVSFEARLDYHEGRCEGRAAKLVRRHLADGCAACTEDLAWIAANTPILRAALGQAHAAVSALALERARQIMPAKPRVEAARSPIKPRGIASAVAALLFDSRIGGRSLAFARDSGDESVHVVYRCSATDIDLWQEPMRHGQWFVTGQALSIGHAELPPPRSVSLASVNLGPQEATIEDGEFSFSNVEVGKYDLRLCWDKSEIRIDDFSVGISG